MEDKQVLTKYQDYLLSRKINLKMIVKIKNKNTMMKKSSKNQRMEI